MVKYIGTTNLVLSYLLKQRFETSYGMIEGNIQESTKQDWSNFVSKIKLAIQKRGITLKIGGYLMEGRKISPWCLEIKYLLSLIKQEVLGYKVYPSSE